MAKKKKTSKTLYILIAAVFIIGGGMFLMNGGTTRQGSTHFGLCKTFLEQEVTYPTTLHYYEVREFADKRGARNVRIYYSATDPFGEYRLNRFTCVFSRKMETAYLLETVQYDDKRPIDKGAIRRFNKSVPTLLQTEMDLTIPSALPQNIRRLQY